MIHMRGLDQAHVLTVIYYGLRRNECIGTDMVQPLPLQRWPYENFNLPCSGFM